MCGVEKLKSSRINRAKVGGLFTEDKSVLQTLLGHNQVVFIESRMQMVFKAGFTVLTNSQLTYS